MKILVPLNQSDITLGKYQEYEELRKQEGDDVDFIDGTLAIFLSIDKDMLGGVSIKDKNKLFNDIQVSLNKDCEMSNTISLDGQPFGFIPNFDAITGDEYTDLVKYADKVEHLHRTMAILFRPITSKDGFKNYEIEYYNGTSDYSELMKSMPMNIVNGCLGFFLTLSNDLDYSILKFTEEEQMKALRH